MNGDGRPMSKNKLVGDHDQLPKSIKKIHGGRLLKNRTIHQDFGKGLYLFIYLFIFRPRRPKAHPKSGIHGLFQHTLEVCTHAHTYIFLSGSPVVSLILWPSCIVPLFNPNGGLLFLFFSFLFFFEKLKETQLDKPLGAHKSSSVTEEGQQDFHLHTSGFEPKTFLRCQKSQKVMYCWVIPQSHHNWYRPFGSSS
jgi:hypothetical protein